MASTGQIIPSYLHPHQMLVINDNTVRQAQDNGAGIYDLKCVNVFACGKGRDNVFIEKFNSADYIAEYGQPSVKYGQETYMPYIELNSRYCSAYCMRVMPDDATFANAILMAEVRYADVPTKITVPNPAYSADENINPMRLKNPAYEEMYIPNPYKNMTTDELISAIGYDILMPNLNFDPLSEISETNPLGVNNIYKIVDGGNFNEDDVEVDIIYDGGDGAEAPEIVIDAMAVGDERNIYYGIDYIVNLKYDPTIEEYIDNPEYEEELIVSTYPKDMKVHVSLTVESIELTTIDELDAAMASILSAGQTADEEGYFKIPLLAFYSTGRGEYGNNYIVNITSDSRGDKTNEYKNYIIKMTNSDGSSSDIFSLVSLYPAAASKMGSSLYISDVVNDYEKGSSNVNVFCYDEGIEALADFIEEKTKVAVDLSTFNVLYGVDKDGKDLPNVIYETIRKNHIDLANNSFMLANGDDGSLSFDNPDRQEVLNGLYMKAFAGLIDRSILSKKRMPVNYLFDANYDDVVKDVMKNLVDNERTDVQGFFDGGLINTTTELKNWVSEQQDNSRNHSVDPFHFKIRDPFTKKAITVTATYFLAQNIARHATLNGLNTPFAQSRYAKVSGIVRGSLKPIIDDIDMDVKELLYTNGINYYEAIGEDEFMRSTQITSQKTNSDLSLENNMRVLLTIARRIEKLNDNYIYNFAEEEDRKLYTDAAQRVLDEFQTMFKDATVEFAMSDYEKEYNILHCYLSIQFKNVIERIITEIDINSAE